MVRIVLICLSFLFLAGCSLSTLPDDAEAEYERILEAISNGNLDYIRDHLREDISATDLEVVLEWMVEFSGGQPFQEANVISMNFSSTIGSGSTYTVTFSLIYPERVMEMILGIQETEGEFVIYALHVEELAEAPGIENLPEFTVADKPTWQKIYLGFMVFVPIFVIFTIVAAIRTRHIHRRPILWPFLILLGVGEVEMIWATGQLDFSLVSFGLFGAGFVSNFSNPGWIMSLYFPLPALWFWYNRITGKVSPKVEAERATEE